MKDYKLYRVYKDGNLENFIIGSSETIEKEINAKDIRTGTWLADFGTHIDVYERIENEGEIKKVKTIKGKIVIKNEMGVRGNGTVRYVAYELITDEKITPIEPVVSEYRLKSVESVESSYLEFNGDFKSTKEIREYIIDNRELYDGYVVRSKNNWNEDVYYTWKESGDNIIWIKSKGV